MHKDFLCANGNWPNGGEMNFTMAFEIINDEKSNEKADLNDSFILYHGTTAENVDSIMKKGLIPFYNWESPPVPVIALTSTTEDALREAYVADSTRVELKEKNELAQEYVVLEVEVKNYTLEDYESNEWWVFEKIRPEDIRVLFKSSQQEALQVYQNSLTKKAA